MALNHFKKNWDTHPGRVCCITAASPHLAPPILGSKPDVPKLKNHWADFSETVQLSVLWFYHSKI